MKDLKNHIIHRGDDFEVSFDIPKGSGKKICFYIYDDDGELYEKQMKEKDGIFTFSIDSDEDRDAFDAMERGDKFYGVRVDEKPRKTIGKGILTIV